VFSQTMSDSRKLLYRHTKPTTVIVLFVFMYCICFSHPPTFCQ